jgi:Zn-dependent M32 family carboxypeptidase
MKRIWFCSLSLFAVLLWASSAMAEFYRYQDSHGNVIYTDDLSKVPTEQRTKAEMYEESHTSNAPEPSQEEKATASDPGQQGADMDSLRKEGERLLKIKGELDKEYNALTKENAELKTEQQSAVTQEQIKAVNQKVVNYNARFQAYQEKSAAYEVEVKAYNERTKAAQTEPQTGSGAN